jgi:hypothetical protein
VTGTASSNPSPGGSTGESEQFSSLSRITTLLKSQVPRHGARGVLFRDDAASLETRR